MPDPLLGNNIELDRCNEGEEKLFTPFKLLSPGEDTKSGCGGTVISGSIPFG